ncbi:Cytochrome c biogenesis ATP-binding export protein CcmA [Nereida ignava]|uniref:Cytochrome c biogenesis ATP-binding export protein CcmA n=2 Tax=Nereida ignava TaxID=282199 RepID=A0A0U1NHD0_9RHOB|nr:Cytochrome c biogenesis ATP-binding export protein CcmA [Nereida ignava]SFJ27039.1 heme exporter protein A [Nereida ignava DSM 16309]
MLELNDVAVARGGITVLEGVSFHLAAGNALILRGENGIGKTTLLRAIAGLQPTVNGTIQAPEESIAFASHADGIKAQLTVRENLEFWAEVYGNASSDVDAAIQAMNLMELTDRPAAQMSAGQKRRLGLGRLLVTARLIWVLDEPTVSLDRASVALFSDVVRAHLAGGGAALIATHIDLGIEAETLDLTPFKAKADVTADTFDGDYW